MISTVKEAYKKLMYEHDLKEPMESMLTPRIYLAGAITFADDGEHGNAWRTFIQNTYTGINWINPLDYEHPDSEYGTFSDAVIVERDLDLIDTCDGILMEVKTDIHQWGTPQEQFYAHGTNVPVVLIYDGDPADMSPWCRFHGNAVESNIENAIETLYGIITGVKYDNMYINTDDDYFVYDEYEAYIKENSAPY